MIESLNRIKRTGLRMLPVLMLAGIPGLLYAQTEKSPLSVDKSGKLVYASDERGNRIPDFSYSGYMAGEKPIPDVPVRVVVPVKSGDAAKRIQAALDYVSSLPPDSEGIRG